jgi:hypothetical protein
VLVAQRLEHGRVRLALDVGGAGQSGLDLLHHRVVLGVGQVGQQGGGGVGRAAGRQQPDGGAGDVTGLVLQDAEDAAGQRRRVRGVAVAGRAAQIGHRRRADGHQFGTGFLAGGGFLGAEGVDQLGDLLGGRVAPGPGAQEGDQAGPVGLLEGVLQAQLVGQDRVLVVRPRRLGRHGHEQGQQRQEEQTSHILVSRV